MKEVIERTEAFRSYRFDDLGPFPPVPFLSNEAYGEAIKAFIRVCADIVPINRERKTIYLAYRRIDKIGWWWQGGKMNPGEEEVEAAVRLMKRESGLIIAPERLRFVCTNRYLHSSQPPQDNWTRTFSLEVSEQEVEQINKKLDLDEYFGCGLKEFGPIEINLETLKDNYLPISNVYWQIFSDRNVLTGHSCCAD